MTHDASSAAPPDRDTVIYDGQCRFCRSQIAILRRLDVAGVLAFVSLHEPQVARRFSGLSRDELMQEMVIVDTRGRVWRGAAAVRYLSRRLVTLWPAAPLLHLPGSMPLWNMLYRIVARNRYRIAGRCEEGGTCRLP